MQQTKPASRWKPWQKWALAICLLAIIGSLLPKKETPVETKAATLPWSQLSNKDKASSIREKLKGSDYYLLVDRSVKASFQYPEEVEYPTLARPSDGNTNILDTVKGKVITWSEVIGKNAFGVKARAVYKAWGTVSDTSVNLDNVELIEKR